MDDFEATCPCILFVGRSLGKPLWDGLRSDAGRQTIQLVAQVRPVSGPRLARAQGE